MQNNDYLAEAFLGCALLDNGILVESIVNPSMMSAKHGNILKVMKRLYSQNVVPDFSALYLDPELSECKELLFTVQDSTASSANWKYYEKQIIEEWGIGRISLLGKIISKAEGTTQELVNVIEKTLLEIGNIDSKNEITPIEDHYDEWLKRLRDRIADRGKIPGISWGFSTIDSCTMGACKNQLVVIGARPSEGKSAIAVQMMRHQAFSENERVGIISIESSSTEIVSRFISGGVPIDGMKINLGLVNTTQLSDIKLFMDRAKDNIQKIFVSDRPGITISELRSAARRMVLNYGIKILYVDYLQLIHVPKSENKITEVGLASVALKEIARELNICVVVLAQLKRDEKNARPTMGSIQWASAVEQTADQIWLLHHKKEGDKILESKIILEKVRDGRTMDIPVKFDKTIVTFFEVEED